jgi:hypothetical protein
MSLYYKQIKFKYNAEAAGHALAGKALFIVVLQDAAGKTVLLRSPAEGSNRPARGAAGAGDPGGAGRQCPPARGMRERDGRLGPHCRRGGEGRAAPGPEAGVHLSQLLPGGPLGTGKAAAGDCLQPADPSVAQDPGADPARQAAAAGGEGHPRHLCEDQLRALIESEAAFDQLLSHVLGLELQRTQLHVQSQQLLHLLRQGRPPVLLQLLDLVFELAYLLVGQTDQMLGLELIEHALEGPEFLELVALG